MSCIAITPGDLDLFIKGMVGFVAGMGFACLVFSALHAGIQVLEDLLRKRGAATPFRERAERAERTAERLSRVFQRVAERNRREAMRRGNCK